MSKIVSVVPNDDYTLLIEFEDGNKISFNMQKLIQTIPYVGLKNLERFKNIEVEDKVISWKERDRDKPAMMPVRLTVDNILFKIRD